MPDQPAGWYRDPCDDSRHRYWDGSRWESSSAEELYGVWLRADAEVSGRPPG